LERKRTTIAAYQDPLDKAVCFAKLTYDTPYDTFHPIPEDANAEDEEHKKRSQQFAILHSSHAIGE